MTLRIIDPSEITDPVVLEGYRQVLAPEESARIARFVFEQDRHVRLVARASLRMMLAEETGVRPRDLQFEYNEYGKPMLQGVHFNVSHTKDRIAIVTSQTQVVGVDVETIREMRDLHSIATRFFAEPEVEALSRLDSAAATERFFQYWTLKEAYIKARGMGLSLPLDQFWFDLSCQHPVILFLQGIKDHSSNWKFRQQRLESGHYVATAQSAVAAEEPL